MSRGSPHLSSLQDQTEDLSGVSDTSYPPTYQEQGIGETRQAYLTDPPEEEHDIVMTIDISNIITWTYIILHDREINLSS